MAEPAPREEAQVGAADLDVLVERLQADVQAYRWAAEQRSRLGVERLLLRAPGIRGLLVHPLKLLLRRTLRWYVEGLAEEQRRFNVATLQLLDELDARLRELERGARADAGRGSSAEAE